MTASTKVHGRSWVSRLLVSLTIGLMMLALGATTAFAAGGVKTAQFAAPVIVTGGTQASFDEDCDDGDDDDCEEGGSGGGGLPSTDTAPLASSSDAGTPLPAIALLVIAGLAGGAMKVASKRSI